MGGASREQSKGGDTAKENKRTTGQPRAKNLHVSTRPPLLCPLRHDSRQQAQVGHKIKDGLRQRSQPGAHPCAVFGHLIVDNLALVDDAAIGLRGHRGRIKMTRTLFKLSKVIDHMKGVSRVSRFYAVTARMMNLTSDGDAPEKNAPAAALRTAQCRTREKLLSMCVSLCGLKVFAASIFAGATFQAARPMPRATLGSNPSWKRQRQRARWAPLDACSIPAESPCCEVIFRRWDSSHPKSG